MVENVRRLDKQGVAEAAKALQRADGPQRSSLVRTGDSYLTLDPDLGTLVLITGALLKSKFQSGVSCVLHHRLTLVHRFRL